MKYARWSGAGVGVGMLRGRGVLGFLVSWFQSFLVSWFLSFLVSWFLGFRVSWFVDFKMCWFLGFLVPWFLGSKVSKVHKAISYFSIDN